MEHHTARALSKRLRAVVLCLVTVSLFFLQAFPASAAGTDTSGSSTAADAPTSTTPPVTAPPPTASAPADTAPPTATSAADPTAIPTSAASGTDSPAGLPSTSTTVPAGSPSSSGVAIITGGQSDLPSVSNQPMPSIAAMRQAISTFLADVIGSALPQSVKSVVGQSVVTDIEGDHSAVTCRCTVAVAISVGGPASAVAIPGLHDISGPMVAGPGSDAAVTGSSGNATSISVTGNGPASAMATSGNAGVPTGGSSGGDSMPGTVQMHGVPLDTGQLAGASRNLASQLLSDNGAAAASLDVIACATLVCTTSPPVTSVDVAAYVPGGSTCASTDTSAPWCTVAISISLNGHAHAVVPAIASLGTSPAGSCGGVAGRPTAIAIGVNGPAQAIARMGASASSACSATDAPATAGGLSLLSAVKATSGSTGDALGIALAEQGAAGSTAMSGNAGVVRAVSDGTGAGALTNSAVATTGSTGDAVGISIGRHGASALVHSGNSGRAAALCTHCTLAGGGTVADAESGHTGSSFSLAVAGQDSYANSLSGDSGDAAAWAVHGSGAVFLTGQGTKSTPDSVVQSGDPGRVYVAGRSGDTGNVVATATDLLTWVSVLTQSGDAGAVVSTATWDANGCTLIFATFTMQCARSARPEPVFSSGTQIVRNPVVSTPKLGVIVVRTGSSTAPTTAPASVSNGGSASGTGPGSAAFETGMHPVTGTVPNVLGGARTRLVSDDVGRSVVSTRTFGPLYSWWAVLALCVVAMLLVALIFIACRYGRPQSMNTS